MFRIKDKDGTTRLEGGALTLAAAVNAFYPVGSIYITTNPTNPGSGVTPQFPGTTWVAWGAGRAIVGVGSNGVNTYTAEQTFGVDSITLTAAQCSVNAHSHAHSLYNPYHNHTQPAHTHGLDWNYVTGANPTGTTLHFAVSIGGTYNTDGSDSSATTDAAGDDTTYGASSSIISGSVDAVSSPTGATPHDIRQTSIATYLWKRTI